MPFGNGGHKFGTPIRPDVRTMPMFFRELGYYTAHIGKFHHTPNKQFPYDTVIADENAGPRFLAKYDGGKPLLLLVCSTFPHTPWAKNETYDPAKVKLPPTFVDTPQTRLDRRRYYTEVTIMDRQLGDVLEGTRKEHRDAIFACHTGNDNGGAGVANDCPMRAVRTATHKYIVNLHPERTFYTHIVGCKEGSPHHLPFWNTWVQQAKTDKRAAGIVDRYLHRPAEELYDIRKDPYEQTNLAADPAQAELLGSLRKQLTEWRKQQGDPALGG